MIRRAPRLRTERRAALSRPRQLALAGGAIIAVVAAALLLDGWAPAHVAGLPVWMRTVAGSISNFGRSGWLLWPVGVALIGLALAQSLDLSRVAKLALAAAAARLGYIFVSVAAPGLAVAIVKRLIGRARPFVEGSDPFLYKPLIWRADYASLPSGHATTAFATAIAVGALWPNARPFVWTYAVLVAASRVVVSAHHPSDVVAGAIVGIVASLCIRDWFARRGLVFTVGQDGRIRPKPGPSLARLAKACAGVPGLRWSRG